MKSRRARHIVIAAPPLRGHLDPLVALATACLERGHRVTIVTDQGARSLIPREIALHELNLRMDGAPLAEAMLDADRPSGLRAMIAAMAARADALCAILPQLFRDLGADLVIADQTEPGAAVAARIAGLPLVTTATALPLDRDASVPPPYLGWAYGAGAMRRRLYEGGYRVSDWLMRPVARALSANSEAAGLGSIRRMDDVHSPDLQLAQIWPGLDYPRDAAIPAMHLLGPFRRGEEATFDPPPDPRPLAFCSLGSLQGGRAEIFQHVARAARNLDLRLLIAHGGRLSAADAARLPGDPLVVDFVPQRAVLKQARVAILHGGMNTVLDALGAGVPIVAIPIAFEQAAIAARVAWLGAGVALKRRQLGRGLEPALRALLADGRYRDAARALGAAAAASGGAREGARLIEDLILRKAASQEVASGRSLEVQSAPPSLPTCHAPAETGWIIETSNADHGKPA
jgi:zeaxanthin glucosyltransferase